MDPSTLFIVRVWRQLRSGRTVFRASVRAVDAEHERVFTRPADLAHYLMQASETPSSTPVSPDESTPRDAA
jgi:hypothetical protein